MKNVCYLLIFFILSCTTVKDKKMVGEDAPEETGVPEWIINPDKGCSEARELCASAEAKSVNEADLNAKKALASIFETKISAEFKMRLSSIERDKSLYKVEEEVREETQESVEAILKGAEIKKRYDHNGIYFSQASLNKKKASTILEREIKLLDDKVFYFLKQKKRSMYEELLIFHEKREILYQKYLLLSAKKLKAPYSFQDIENLRYSAVDQKKNISIKASENLTNELLKYIENSLTSSGYEITAKNNYFYIVIIKWQKTPLRMNVQGFKKVQFELSIEVRNNSYKKIGGMIITEIATGRNEEQAYHSIKDTIKKKISSSLSELNMY